MGRLIHFDQREPILQRYQYFEPHPVAGTNGLLSWLTSQEKMAEEIIKSESREFFHWVCHEPSIAVSTILLSN